MLWLDWVRVLAMGIIFLFHSSRPFVIFLMAYYDPLWIWDLLYSTPSFWLDHAFVLAVSGIAVYSSLAKRSASQFVGDRFTKLIIPSFRGLAYHPARERDQFLISAFLLVNIHTSFSEPSSHNLIQPFLSISEGSSIFRILPSQVLFHQSTRL
jgi:hypothetical protein